MTRHQSFAGIAIAMSAMALSAAFAIYLLGYVAGGYVGTFGKSKTRYYKYGWVARIYWPAAMVESLLTAHRVAVVQDVCGTGYMAEMTSKEFNSP